MNKNKDVFRPRLTRVELYFISLALRNYREAMATKQAEMQAREWRIEKLRRKFIQTAEGLPELTRERNKLTLDKQQDYFGQELVASALVRRFDAMAEGGRLHSGMTTYTYLKRFELVPKTPEKTNSRIQYY